MTSGILFPKIESMNAKQQFCRQKKRSSGRPNLITVDVDDVWLRILRANCWMNIHGVVVLNWDITKCIDIVHVSIMIIVIFITIVINISIISYMIISNHYNMIQNAAQIIVSWPNNVFDIITIFSYFSFILLSFLSITWIHFSLCVLWWKQKSFDINWFPLKSMLLYVVIYFTIMINSDYDDNDDDKYQRNGNSKTWQP